MPEPADKKTQDDKTPAIEELQKTMQNQEAELAKYKQLMQDPTMQNVLNKMAKGEEIILADKKTETLKPVTSMKSKLGIKEKPGEVNLDELSNTDMSKVMAESVENYVNDIREESAAEQRKQLDALNQKLDETQNALLTLSAQQRVKDVASKHKDFETYRPAMQELSQKYPQMEMNDLYKLAKADHLIKSPGRATVETEKPESSSQFPNWEPVHMRDPETGDKTKSVGPSTTALRSGGRKDFLGIVGEAASRFVNGSNMGGQ